MNDVNYNLISYLIKAKLNNLTQYILKILIKFSKQSD